MPFKLGLQSGGVFKIYTTKASKGPDSRVDRYGQGTSLPTMDASGTKVPQKADNVNGQFSLKDSQGRELSEGQQEYFEDSQVRWHTLARKNMI